MESNTINLTLTRGQSIALFSGFGFEHKGRKKDLIEWREMEIFVKNEDVYHIWPEQIEDMVFCLNYIIKHEVDEQVKVIKRNVAKKLESLITKL